MSSSAGDAQLSQATGLIGTGECSVSAGAGSAGERVKVGKRLASSPCFSEQESESLESLACGTRSYFEPSLIQWKVRGGVI